MNTSKLSLRDILSAIAYNLKAAWEVDRLIAPMHLASHLLQVATPFIAIFLPKMIIDALTTPQVDIQSLLVTLGQISLILVIVQIAGALAERYVEENAYKVRTGGFIRVLHKVMTMDYQVLESPLGQDSQEKGMMALDNQNSGMQTVVADLAGLIAHLIGLALYGMIASYLNPWIFIALVAVSLLNYAAVREGQKYEDAHRDEVAVVNKRIRYMRETALDYRGGKDLRLYRMTGWFESIYQGYIDHYLSLMISFFKRHFSADVLATVLDLIRDGGAYFYLITRLLQNEISVGDFTLYFGAIAGISSWMTRILADIAALQKGCVQVQELRRFLDLAGYEDPDPLPLHPEEIIAPEFVLENVSFRYGESSDWVLRDFNLTIHAGEKIALVGANGAGKTTLVKLLTGLYRPTEGRILMNGIDICRYPKAEYYKLMGVVLQEVTSLAMTLAQNVSALSEDDTDEDRVWQCLQLAGMEARVHDFPKGLQTQLTRMRFKDGIELSGGQAQKLMLARALYKDAPVVIMDEPTAALDPIAEAEMYEHYDRMVANKTSLYISHRLASTRFCDRIAYLEDSRIAELGSHSELIALGGKYAVMYAVQSQYYQEDFTEIST